MPKTRYLGLDVGASSAKAVVLDSAGAICGSGVLDMRAEGILNDAEMYGSVAEWLGNEKWKKCKIAAGLPQYMTTTLMRNYPEKLPVKAIRFQLQGEASQVAALSDEAMLQDCCILGKTCLRSNSVVISIAREQNVRERLGAMSVAGIEAEEIVPGGIAISNAFYHLHPELVDSKDPVLLLEFGHENSTAIVLAGGQPLFISSLLFSSEKINEIIKRRGAEHNMKMEERDMRSIDLAVENSHSSVMEAIFLLENEIHSFVESWRAQETEELAQVPVGQVYVCGGLAQMKGLGDWLAERLEVPVQVLAPEVEGRPRPELTLAYGLALQFTGKARLVVTLLPMDIRFHRLRERNWPLLLASIVVLALAFAVIDIHKYLQCVEQMAQIKMQKKELETCTKEISAILDLQRALKFREMSLAPLIVAGNQHSHLCAIINAISGAKAEKDWFVYLADEASYQSNRNSGGIPQKRRPSKAPNLFSQENSALIGDIAGRDEFPLRYDAEQMSSTLSYIAAGYTPQVPNEPFKPVRDILRKLEETGIFVRSDILAESERIGREDIFQPWQAFLKKVPGGQFNRAFTVRLPLKKPDIAPGQGAVSSNDEEDE
ncbi:MAG: pilus assembly protein PilM [Victivallales bacterium]|nr:pilus assembly protein PilM [Victivallales bacterium]